MKDYSLFSQTSPRVRGEDAWTFGLRQRRGPARLLSSDHSSYILDLNAHSGVVVGLPWEGVTGSLDRLAASAARQGWKVILFDPLGTQANAEAFTSLYQQHAHRRTTVYRRYVVGHGSVSPLHTRTRRRVLSSRETAERAFSNAFIDYLRAVGYLPSPDEGMFQHNIVLHSSSRTLSALTHCSWLEQDGRAWSDAATYADGVYLGFNAWQRPEQARRDARALLHSLLQSMGSQPNEPQVLLLIKHPDLLFEAHEIAPLFSFFEDHGGSVFVGVRSVADLGKDAHRVLKNAQTLIAHRSPTSLPIEQYVSPAWWQQSELKASIRSLPDDECLVIHRGACTHVHVFPVHGNRRSSSSNSVRPRTLNNESLEETDEVNKEESDLDILLASIFGPERSDVELVAPFPPPVRPFSPLDTLLVRTLRDQVRLLRALSLLGRMRR